MEEKLGRKKVILTTCVLSGSPCTIQGVQKLMKVVNERNNGRWKHVNRITICVVFPIFPSIHILWNYTCIRKKH